MRVEIKALATGETYAEQKRILLLLSNFKAIIEPGTLTLPKNV